MKTRIFRNLALATIIATLSTACTVEGLETNEQLQSIAVKAEKVTYNFNSSLKGSNEVVPVGTKAAGHVSVKISKDGTSLYYKITAANLDDVFAAHFHRAAAGSNGGVVTTLYSNPNQPSGPQNGVLAEGTVTAANVSGSLIGNFQGLVDEIRAGNIYVNVHSLDHPSGELRGQL